MTRLNYFGLPGRAEATRVALAYAGKDFEDHQMDFAEYGASKWAGKGVPVLEVRTARLETPDTAVRIPKANYVHTSINIYGAKLIQRQTEKVTDMHILP